MKKKFLVVLILFLFMGVLLWRYGVPNDTGINHRQIISLNDSIIKSISDVKLKFDENNYPIIKAVNNEKKNYKKNFYKMYPKIPGFDARGIVESWTFISEGKKYYAFQNNDYIHVKRADDEKVETSYHLAIYDSNKKLKLEFVNRIEDGKNIQHILLRQGDSIDAKLVTSDIKTGKIIKKSHKVLKIVNSEYISTIEDLLALVPYEQIFEQKSKKYCIYSEDQMKLNNYTYKLNKKKQKTKQEPWTIEFEEIKEKSNKSLNVKECYDTENHISYKADYGQIGSILTDYMGYFSTPTLTMGMVNIDIPLNFWLLNDKDLEELDLEIKFNIKDAGKYIKNSPRQKIKKINGNTFVVTLSPEKYSLPSSEKVLKKEIEDALESTINYPSNDINIQRLAYSITKNGNDNIEKSFLIMNWIKENIKWTYDSNTDVLTTLVTKKGDCSERSALFVTLARAIGIPTESIGGYSIGIDSLGGHAWAKIYENNRWIEMDPSTAEFINTSYLSTENMLLPKDIKSVQVLEVKYKNSSAKKINRNKPFIKYSQDFYSNRILGLSFKMPEYAKLKPTKKNSSMLFRVSLRQSIFNLSNLIKNSEVANTKNMIIIDQYDKNLFKENKYAKNARFNGVEIKDRYIVEKDGHNLLVEKFDIPNRNGAGVVYLYPLKDKCTICFLAVGTQDSINLLSRRAKVPQLFVDILKGTKRINQEF